MIVRGLVLAIDCLSAQFGKNWLPLIPSAIIRQSNRWLAVRLLRIFYNTLLFSLSPRKGALLL
jgi:hypothetical protein